MLTMKTLTILASASLAALVFASASLEVATSLFSAVGILAIVIRDYSHTPRTFLTESALAGATSVRSERLGLAA